MALFKRKDVNYVIRRVINDVEWYRGKNKSWVTLQDRHNISDDRMKQSNYSLQLFESKEDAEMIKMELADRERVGALKVIKIKTKREVY